MMNNIKILKKTTLSKGWSTLEKFEVGYTDEKGEERCKTLEAYQRGDGVAVFLYNPVTKNIILTRQFRLPTYINGNADGMLVEVCAGKLDVANPEECIMREILEETGYQVPEVKKIFEAYPSPGSVSEKIFFYTALYDAAMKTQEGGGLEEEQEEIEVLELPFATAYDMIAAGEIRDAKTILLLQYAKINRLLD
jgi:GDP-mannose pyrophosphatase NudK